jgi:hypothetical protein
VWFIGRLVVEDEAVDGGIGLPGSCGVEEEGFCAMVGTLALDLRLEPNPRPLKREFIELIRPERCNQCEERKEEYGEETAWASRRLSAHSWPLVLSEVKAAVLCCAVLWCCGCGWGLRCLLQSFVLAVGRAGKTDPAGTHSSSRAVAEAKATAMAKAMGIGNPTI